MELHLKKRDITSNKNKTIQDKCKKKDIQENGLWNVI